MSRPQHLPIAAGQFTHIGKLLISEKAVRIAFEGFAPFWTATVHCTGALLACLAIRMCSANRPLGRGSC